MSISGPKQIANIRASALHVDSSVSALVVHSVDATGAYVSPGAGSTQVSIKEILSSSGGSLIDSTNVSLGVTIRAGSASGIQYTDGDIDATITGDALLFDNSSNTLRPVTITRGLPVNVVAGSAGGSTDVVIKDSSGVFYAGSTSTAPPSGAQGLVVRLPAPITDSTNNALRIFDAAPSTGPFVISSVVGVVTVSTGPFAVSSIAGVSVVSPQAGSTWATRPLQSSAADLQMTATPAAGSTWNVRPLQSSAADLQVTATPAAGSTFNVRPLQSSAADLQVTATPAAGSTFNVRPLQSSAADLQVTATIGANLQSTVAASSNSSALVVRPVLDNILTFMSTNVFASTLAAINSTAAGQKCKVFAYSITSTVQTPTTIKFYGGSTVIWPVILAAISSAVTGVNIAVTPPAFLFAGDAASSVTVRTASSVAGFKMGVSYFMAP